MTRDVLSLPTHGQIGTHSQTPSHQPPPTISLHIPPAHLKRDDRRRDLVVNGIHALRIQLPRGHQGTGRRCPGSIAVVNHDRFLCNERGKERGVEREGERKGGCVRALHFILRTRGGFLTLPSVWVGPEKACGSLLLPFTSPSQSHQRCTPSTHTPNTIAVPSSEPVLFVHRRGG